MNATLTAHSAKVAVLIVENTLTSCEIAGSRPLMKKVDNCRDSKSPAVGAFSRSLTTNVGGLMKASRRNLKTFFLALLLFYPSITYSNTIKTMRTSISVEIPMDKRVSFIVLDLPTYNIDYRIKNIQKPVLKLNVVIEDDENHTELRKWGNLLQTPITDTKMKVFFSSHAPDSKADGYGTCSGENGAYSDVEGVCVLSGTFFMPRGYVATVYIRDRVLITKEEMREESASPK